MAKLCVQCPNRCQVDRTSQHGACGVNYDAIISRIGLHMWEEPIISGTQGSGTIFFAGCNMGCVYCQNYQISHSAFGKRYTIEQLIAGIRDLEKQGAHNINFVNPSHYTHILHDVLTQYKPSVPIVYNTSGYDSVDSLKQLDGLIDIYLPDYKYMQSDIAAKYSHRANYPTVAWDAIAEMVRQQPTCVIKDGILQKGVVIRHLVLPGMSGQSVEILQKLYNTYGEHVYYSVMSQYTPYGEANQYPEINRKLRPLEYKRAVAALLRMNVTNAFIQDENAADTAYIPPFEGE